MCVLPRIKTLCSVPGAFLSQWSDTMVRWFPDCSHKLNLSLWGCLLEIDGMVLPYSVLTLLCSQRDTVNSEIGFLGHWPTKVSVCSWCESQHQRCEQDEVSDLEHPEAFYFSAVLTQGRSLASEVLCPLEQVEQCCQQSFVFFFLFEPLVFFETFILLHPLATQPHKELDFPGGSAVKNLPANAGDTGDLGLILGGEDPLEKGMATHPSVLTWRIPWTEEPGGLLSVGSKRVGRDLATEHKLMPQGMHAVIYFDKFRHSFSELFFKAEGEQWSKGPLMDVVCFVCNSTEMLIFFNLWPFSPRGEMIRLIKGRDLFSEYSHSPFYRRIVFPKVHLLVFVWNVEFLARWEDSENYG